MNPPRWVSTAIGVAAILVCIWLVLQLLAVLRAA